LRDEAWPYHGIFLTAHRVRLLSVLLGGATVLLTYFIALTYTADRRVAFGAAAFTAFLPGFLFASATIDNDALVNPLAAALLFLTLRYASGTTARHRYLAIAAGIIGCLALFTKLDAIVPIAVATFIFFLWTPHRQRLAILASTMLPLMPAAVFWLWRIKAAHQHNLIGQGVTWPPPLPGSTSPLDWHEPFIFLRDLWTSFVGTFGWQDVWLPPLWYLPFALVIGAGLASWGYAYRCSDSTAHRQQSLILLAWSFAVLAAVVGRPFLVDGSLAGYDHGRFLYPALPAIATMVATGWQRLLTRWSLFRRFFRPVLALDILSAFLIPWLVIRPAYPPPYPVQDHLPPDVHRLTNAQFRASVALAAITLPSCPIGPGLGTFVTFYWRVQQPLPAGTWLFVHVVNSHGVKAAAFDGPPLYDTFPVTSWRQGDVIIDREILTIAKTAPPGEYTVKLGWYNPKTGVRIPLISGATEVLAGHLRVGSPPLHGRQCRATKRSASAASSLRYDTTPTG
jgi:hypothetical protein